MNPVLPRGVDDHNSRDLPKLDNGAFRILGRTVFKDTDLAPASPMMACTQDAGHHALPATWHNLWGRCNGQRQIRDDFYYHV